MQLRAKMGTGATDIAAIAPEAREQLPALTLPLRFGDSEQARFRLFEFVTTLPAMMVHRRYECVYHPQSTMPERTETTIHRRAVMDEFDR